MKDEKLGPLQKELLTPTGFKAIDLKEFLDLLTSMSSDNDIDKTGDIAQDDKDKMSVRELVDELNTNLKNSIDIVCDLLLHSLTVKPKECL